MSVFTSVTGPSGYEVNKCEKIITNFTGKVGFDNQRVNTGTTSHIFTNIFNFQWDNASLQKKM